MGAVEKVGKAVKGVADKIKSFLGFSEPEDGPLSDFHTYMPDMIDLMAQGIQAGKEKVKDAIGELAQGMSVSVNSEVSPDMPNVGNLLASGIGKAKIFLDSALGEVMPLPRPKWSVPARQQLLAAVTVSARV